MNNMKLLKGIFLVLNVAILFVPFFHYEFTADNFRTVDHSVFSFYDITQITEVSDLPFVLFIYFTCLSPSFLFFSINNRFDKMRNSLKLLVLFFAAGNVVYINCHFIFWQPNANIVLTEKGFLYGNYLFNGLSLASIFLYLWHSLRARLRFGKK
jgi:hypothetical protein